jgi:hypothetical protein
MKGAAMATTATAKYMTTDEVIGAQNALMREAIGA